MSEVQYLRTEEEKKGGLGDGKNRRVVGGEKREGLVGVHVGRSYGKTSVLENPGQKNPRDP